MIETMWTRWLSALVLFLMVDSLVSAQDKPLVDFQKHVQPILEQRCLSCHGPKEAKNDFRVDDRDSLVSYLESGNATASTLWTDYLITDDPEMLMPPGSATESGGLPVGELLVIKAWIDEGAHGNWATDAAQEVTDAETKLPASDLEKWWSFQGLFHPAMVHFPVALLSVSALFVFLSFFSRDSCEPVAYHCLWIGALGAAFACVTGWAYATYKGYAGVSFDFENSGIDRHRWAGIFVAVFAFLVVPLARSVRQTGSSNSRIIWLLASMILALGVSLAGYQGGELTYGEDHYMKYFRQLFPSHPVAESAVEETSDSSETADLQAVQDEPSASFDQPTPSANSETELEPAEAVESESSETTDSSEGISESPSVEQPDDSESTESDTPSV